MCLDRKWACSSSGAGVAPSLGRWGAGKMVLTELTMMVMMAASFR